MNNTIHSLSLSVDALDNAIEATKEAMEEKKHNIFNICAKYDNELSIYDEDTMFSDMAVFMFWDAEKEDSLNYLDLVSEYDDLDYKLSRLENALESIIDAIKELTRI